MQTLSEFIKWEVASRKTIALKLIYVDIAGDLLAGLLLSQIVYWHLPDRNGNTKLRVKKGGALWLVKSDADWYDEVRLTEAQARRARTILTDSNLIEVEIHRFNGAPTCHIRINEGMFMDMLNGRLELEHISDLSQDTEQTCAATQIRNEPEDKSLTESTSEITSREYSSQTTTPQTGASQSPTVLGEGVLKIHPGKEATTRVVTVRVRPWTTQFDCPDCGHTCEWPTSKRERRKEQYLRCPPGDGARDGCGVYFHILEEDREGKEKTSYRIRHLEPDGEPWVVEVPGLGRWETRQADAEICRANWKEDPEGMRSSLKWALKQGMKNGDVVPRANAGFATKSTWVKKDEPEPSFTDVEELTWADMEPILEE